MIKDKTLKSEISTVKRAVWPMPMGIDEKQSQTNDYDAYYEEIKPVLVALVVCGKLPSYKRTKDKKFESNFLSWNFLYWVIHFTLLTLIGLEQLFEYCSDFMKEDVHFSIKIEHGIIFTIVFFLHFTTPVCFLHERKAVIALINSWPPLLVQLEVALGEKFVPRYSTLIRILVWTEPPVIIGTVLIERNLLLRGKYWRLPLYASGFQASHYIFAIWLFSFLEMKSIARKIENAIEKISTGGVYALHNGCNLEDLRILWLRLSVVVQQTGEAFSISVISIVTCLVTVFIISWFSVICSFIHSGYTNQAGYVTGGTITGLMILVLSEPAHRVTEAVGERILRALSFIELTHLPSSVQQQVHSFTRTITLNYPTVSLSGLTPVNRAWLPSVVASVITYLIVLVQFQAEERNEPTDSVH